MEGNSVLIKAITDTDSQVTSKNIYAFRFNDSKRKKLVLTGLKNLTDHRQPYELRLLDSFPGNNGRIIYRNSYSSSGIKRYSNSQFKHGTLLPHESKKISFLLDASKNPGRVELGGIQVTIPDSKKDAEVRNDVSLITGIVLAPKRASSYNISRISLVSGVVSKKYNFYKIMLGNSNKEIISKIHANFLFYRDGKVIKTKRMDNLSFLPSSSSNFYLSKDNCDYIKIILKLGGNMKTLYYYPNNKIGSSFKLFSALNVNIVGSLVLGVGIVILLTLFLF